MLHDHPTVRGLYRQLLTLYPKEFRTQLGESMEQTFGDLYREQYSEGGSFLFILWTFAETALGIVREHVLLITKRGAMKDTLATERPLTMTIQKWGGLACFLLAVAFIVPSFIYLTGNLRDALGPFTYDLADFLYGPVWAASLVAAVYALREHMGERAPRRMNLALLTALFAAAAMVAVACIRSANRHYHLNHPDLNLEASTSVLVVWTTLIAGVTASGWHFLGWSFILIGWAGWASRRLPRVLCALYLTGGVTALFVYLMPDMEGAAALFGVVVSIWQGILLLRAEPDETQTPEISASRPLQA